MQLNAKSLVISAAQCGSKQLFRLCTNWFHVECSSLRIMGMSYTVNKT